MNFSAPARAWRISWYKSKSAHFFKRAGSLCVRFAFCAKAVLGRLTVFFKSSGVSVDIGFTNSSRVKLSTKVGRLRPFVFGLVLSHLLAVCPRIEIWESEIAKA